jgi:hypothetical protein
MNSYTVLYDHPVHGTLAITRDGALPQVGEVLDLTHQVQGRRWQVRGRVDKIGEGESSDVVILEDDVEVQ